MKKAFIGLSMILALGAQAQVGVEKSDSIEMGDGYVNDVYYSLLDGAKETEANTNWHIAFRTGGQTDGIRINSATGTGAANANTSVYVYPNGKITDWASFDSAGCLGWQKLENSDESWEVGAFNTTAGQFPDFGWGTYNMSTHVVSGDSIYFITFMNNGVTEYRKLYIDDKTSGNWTFTYADLDGSNEQTVTLKSSDYSGKNYIYYNLSTNTALDREPAAWDFVSTRYNALQVTGTYAGATGILTNIGVWVAKAEGKDADDLELADSTADGFSDLINTIGYGWKHYEFGGQGVTWHTEDSLAYFIQDQGGILWKVVFTDFTGSTGGKSVFNKTQLTPGTAVKTASALEQTSVYPNPTNGAAQLVISSRETAQAQVIVTDMNGRTVQSASVLVGQGLEVINLDLNGLNSGVYFVQVKAEGFSSTQKLIKY